MTNKGEILKALILVLNIVVLMTGCDSAVNSELSSGSSRGSTAASSLPTRWSSASVFPLNIQMSTDFSNEEISAISDSADVWSEEQGNGADFFAQTTENISPKSNLDSYNDSVFGIYKIFSWPSELPSGALAVTQIRGLQRSSSIQITHADILVNYDFFDFTTDGAWGYDLQTVLVHELGHFLGLGHENSSTSESVMFPSIGRFTVNQTPHDNDIDNLSAKYGLTRSASNNRGISNGINNEEGTPITITFELHANNKEVVRINGVIDENFTHNHHHNH